MSPALCDENTWVIYGLRLVDDFEYRYVGLTTVGPTLRLQRHKYDAKKNPNRHVCHWVNKHRDNITIDVLEVCEIGESAHLWEAEQFWISQIRGFGHSLTNASLGGESGCYGARWSLSDDQIRSGERHPFYGKTHTQESRELISLSKTGTLRSEESRKKQGDSIRGSNHWAYGIKKSEEYRSKISETLKGRTLSDEHKKKMSDSRKGKPLPKSNQDKGRHVRWHVNRSITKDDCNYCKEQLEQGSN